MQDRTLNTPATPTASPHLSNARVTDEQDTSSKESPSAASPTEATEETSMLDQSLNSLKETLDEHKGKLAISAAAMLGLLVYYKWGEKSLAKEDPEEYERLQRIKNRVRHADDEYLPGENTAASSLSSARNEI